MPSCPVSPCANACMQSRPQSVQPWAHAHGQSGLANQRDEAPPPLVWPARMLRSQRVAWQRGHAYKETASTYMASMATGAHSFAGKEFGFKSVTAGVCLARTRLAVASGQLSALLQPQKHHAAQTSRPALSHCVPLGRLKGGSWQKGPLHSLASQLSLTTN